MTGYFPYCHRGRLRIVAVSPALRRSARYYGLSVVLVNRRSTADSQPTDLWGLANSPLNEVMHSTWGFHHTA